MKTCHCCRAFFSWLLFGRYCIRCYRDRTPDHLVTATTLYFAERGERPNGPLKARK